MSSISSTAKTSPATSIAFSRLSAKCWCDITLKGTLRSTEDKRLRLRRLSDYLHSQSQSLFMFELPGSV